ncbi:MAG: hypothetical protein E7350_02210 [Clostridiales bacterium]|nr:hypothetical protein [Clostridiales bacterium]
MDELYIEDIVEDVRRDYENRRAERKNIEAVWQLNTNFVMGNQFSYINALGEVEDGERDYYWQEREVFNHIASIVESRQAKLGRVRPKMSVRPASGDDDDVRTAKVATKILEGSWHKHDISDLVTRATMWSETTGSVFYKIVWDDEAGSNVGEVDGKNVREGDIRIDVCSPYEIFPASLAADTMEEQSSIIHAKAMHIDDIYRKWGKSVEGTETDVIGVSDCSPIGGLGFCTMIPAVRRNVKKDYAVVIERYTRPTTLHPNGELAIVAGDQLLYYGELPYANGKDGARDFPFVKQDSIKTPGCFFGGSMVERCIPIQRAYNAVKNRKHEFMNRIAMGVLAVEDGSVDITNLEEEGLSPGKILVYRQGATPPMLLNPGSVPTDFSYEEDKLLSEFISVSGVSEIMRTSSVPSSVTSGTALQLLLEQDDTRLSVTAERIRTAIKQMGQHILRLYKQFASDLRVMRSVGADGVIEVISWNNSDISCDDITFDTENELNTSIASKQNMIFELLRAGLLYDENGKLSANMRYKILDIMGYGGWETVYDSQKLHAIRAQKENLGVAKAEPEVYEFDDHGIHISEHTRYLLSNEFEQLCSKNEVLRERIENHVRAHKTHMKLLEETTVEKQI